MTRKKPLHGRKMENGFRRKHIHTQFPLSHISIEDEQRFWCQVFSFIISFLLYYNTNQKKNRDTCKSVWKKISVYWYSEWVCGGGEGGRASYHTSPWTIPKPVIYVSFEVLEYRLFVMQMGWHAAKIIKLYVTQAGFSTIYLQFGKFRTGSLKWHAVKIVLNSIVTVLW